MAKVRRRTFDGRIIGKKYWYMPEGAGKLVAVPALYAMVILFNVMAFAARPSTGFINLFFAILMSYFLLPYIRQIKKVKSETHVFSRYTILRDSVDDWGNVTYHVQWEDYTTGWVQPRSSFRQRFSFQEVP
ncbi:MAG: hypothetical protein H9W81_13840 [Enterococcus sp.]|nr:hypothetical protein [Enterococcus sp.]